MGTVLVDGGAALGEPCAHFGSCTAKELSGDCGTLGGVCDPVHGVGDGLEACVYGHGHEGIHVETEPADGIGGGTCRFGEGFAENTIHALDSRIKFCGLYAG